MNIHPDSLSHSAPVRPSRAWRLALVVASCLPLLCSCGPTAAPSRGDPVLADIAFFGPPIAGIVKETREYLDKELKKSSALPAGTSGAGVEKADFSLTADFPLPAGMAPRFSGIAGKYGQPDRSEPASTKEGALTIHYYGDIGLGVSGSADTGTVTRIYVRRTVPLKH